MTMPAHRSDRVQLLKQVQTFTLELLHCFTSVILAITLPQEPVSKKTNKQHILYIYISLVSCWRLPSLYLSHSLSHLSLSLSLSLTRLHFLNYCSSPSEPWFLTLVLAPRRFRRVPSPHPVAKMATVGPVTQAKTAAVSTEHMPHNMRGL